MKFEVKKVEYQGVVQKQDDTTFIQFVNVTTGIVGNPYSGFDEIDTVKTTFPSTGLDASQIAEKIQSDAISFSKEKYPDTES